MTVEDALIDAVERCGSVLVCRVSGGPGNVLSMSGIVAATQAVCRLPAGVRSIVLVGAGEQFCTGGDVRAFASADAPGRLVHDMASTLHGFVRALVTAPVPVVAKVRGWAAGAGLSLACVADIAICAESARFAVGYPGIGLSPDGGLTWTLPRRVGTARAADLLLRNATLTADEARDLGLVATVVPDAELDDAVSALTSSFEAASRSALASVKGLLAGSPTRPLSEQLDAEADAIARAADSPDGREGVRAFVRRRAPSFEDGGS